VLLSLNGLRNSSVERVVEYLDIPQEPPGVIEGRSVPAYWPSTTSQPISGSFINVKDLVVRYAPELEPVLHGVSFSLRAGEKVGLLGRTGSGKSTLGTFPMGLTLIQADICQQCPC
jgi:ABC-type multidrug transport system fused ATPase/permease subunit